MFLMCSLKPLGNSLCFKRGILVHQFITNVWLSYFLGYELFAFISHMGASTMSGHYICHIKKEGRWVVRILIKFYLFVCSLWYKADRRLIEMRDCTVNTEVSFNGCVFFHICDLSFIFHKRCISFIIQLLPLDDRKWIIHNRSLFRLNGKK